MSCGRRMSTWLAGKKDIDADVDEQAALDFAGDHAADDVAFLVLGDDFVPFFLPLRLAVAEDDAAAFVFDGFHQNVDGIARLGRHDASLRIVKPFAQLDGAFALVTDIDPDVIGGNFADLAGDDAIVTELLFLGGEPVGDFIGKNIV